MDTDRARSLLIAERDEVQSLLKDAEDEGRQARVAEVDSEAEDNADAALALTEEGQDDAVAESLRNRAGRHRACAAPAGRRQLRPLCPQRQADP